MNLNFATWSLRKPIPSVLLFFLLTLSGVFALRSLPHKNMPDFDVGIFKIAIALPGASPAQLETEVVRPVEDAIAVLQQVHLIKSQISEGLVLTRVEFELGRNPAEAYFDLKNALDRIRGSLPAAAEEPRIRQNTIAGGAPTVTYALTSDALSEEQLTWFVQDTITRALLTVQGVNRVDQLGGVTREIAVDVDPVRLSARGLTAAEVSRALRQTQEEASGGRGRLGGAEQGVRTLATVSSAADLSDVELVVNEQHLRLKDVAVVSDTLADRTTSGRWDGKPAVGFQVLHNPGTDEIKLTDEVIATLTSIEKAHPEVHFDLIGSMKQEVSTQFDNSMHMLAEGALLSVLVIWLFLRNWRSTLVGAFALPLSILPTFTVLYVAGFTLNTVTVLALTVIVGILVDDAIVEVENITRHLKAGGGVREATMKAVTEIGLAVIATTLALVIVFLPMSFMAGEAGNVFRQFGWTAAAAILASLLVARLITPLLAVWLLKPDTTVEREGRVMRGYLHAVRFCLAHKHLSVVLPLSLLSLATYLWLNLPQGYIPPQDANSTTITVKLPAGSTLEQTLTIAEEARRAIMVGPNAVRGVLHVFTRAGQSEIMRNGASGGSAEVSTAELAVVLASWGQRGTEEAVEKQIHDRLALIAGAKFNVNGVGYGSRLNLILSGRNPKSLEASAKALTEELEALPGLSGVTSSAGLERSDIVVRPDFTRAAELGVTTETIADTVRIATSGDYAQGLAKLNLETRALNIRVRLPPESAADLSTISELRVKARDGLVPLSSVAHVSVENGPLEIDHFNRQRHITVSADLSGMPLGEARAKAAKLAALATLPPDVKWLKDSETESMDALFVSVGNILIVAAICAYCLLVLLFKNFFQPLTILSAVPLSVSGALLGVLCSGNEIDEPVLLGFVILLGIVTKNSILLVDYALEAIKERKLSEIDALVEACKMRARPIVMTTLAMVAGMLPIVLQLEEGDTTYQEPLAATVIGGLLVGTALSLLAVPVVFVYVAKLERAVHRLLKR